MTASEILLLAYGHIGTPRDGGRGWTTMDLQDAIAEATPRDPVGAIAAFGFLRKATGAENLIEWQNGKTDAQLKAVCRKAARLATQ